MTLIVGLSCTLVRTSLQLMSHITQGFRIDNKHNKYYCENTKRNEMWHLTLSTLVKFINIEEETLFTLQGSKEMK